MGANMAMNSVGNSSAGDGYGGGFSVERGLANTPKWLWGIMAGMLCMGVLCLNAAGWITF